MKNGEQPRSVIHKTIEEVATELTKVLRQGRLVALSELGAPSSKLSDNKNHPNLLVIVEKQLDS